MSNNHRQWERFVQTTLHKPSSDNDFRTNLNHQKRERDFWLWFQYWYRCRCCFCPFTVYTSECNVDKMVIVVKEMFFKYSVTVWRGLRLSFLSDNTNTTWKEKNVNVLFHLTEVFFMCHRKSKGCKLNNTQRSPRWPNDLNNIWTSHISKTLIFLA